MKKMLMGLVLVGMASAAHAKEPVYLKCTVEGDEWSLAMDEDNSTVTWSNVRGNGTKNARFSADKVEWGSSKYLPLYVDRVSLRFHVGTSSGPCVIEKKTRAF